MLTLEDALQLVRLYGERDSRKYEKAALRWLERYLVEGSSITLTVSKAGPLRPSVSRSARSGSNRSVE